MCIYFTSDTHFGHTNIIKYCNRPFASVHEMNVALIQNWNSVVGKYDVVYHLGDFAFRPKSDAESFLSRLNGEIHLIKGNHDRKIPDGFANVSLYEEINYRGIYIVLCHYAMRVWNKSHRGSIMLYGHSHGSLPGTPQSLDVGVDCWNYKPVGLDEILNRLQENKTTMEKVVHASI